MGGFNRLGATLQSAEASGFFQWFTLERVEGETPDPGRHAIHYRPNGPAFHALAEVVLTADSDGLLQEAELRLARAFIEHHHNGLFARDITRSFLRDSIAGADADRLGDLMNEIEFPRTIQTPHLTARTAETALPEVPSPGYAAYLGRRGRWDFRGAAVRLVLENYLREAEPWFRVSLASR